MSDWNLGILNLFQMPCSFWQFYRISLSIQTTKSDGNLYLWDICILFLMSFVVPIFANIKQMIDVTANLVVTMLVITAVTTKRVVLAYLRTAYIIYCQDKCYQNKCYRNKSDLLRIVKQPNHLSCSNYSKVCLVILQIYTSFIGQSFYQ